MITAEQRIQRRRTYPATRQPDGLWTINHVPVLLAHKVPLLGPDGQPITRNGKRLVFRFTKKWLEQAKANMDANYREDGYEALVHINHHNRGRPVKDAGLWRPEGVRRFSYRGRRCWALFAQLYDVPDEVYQGLRKRRLKYVSAEVNSLARAPEVDSLALLRDTVPFFRLAPIVPHEVGGYGDVRNVQSGAVVQASDSRRFQVAMFMGMATEEAGAMCGDGVCKCHGACGGKKSPGGQMSEQGGGSGKNRLRDIVSRVGESHKSFMAALDDLQQVIDGDSGGEDLDGAEDPGPGAAEQGAEDSEDGEDEGGEDEEEEGLKQARQFVDEDDEDEKVSASDNTEGHREDDDDAEGDYKSQMQAEIERRDVEIARLQGQLRGKAAVGDAQERREAAIQKAVEALRPLGVTRAEIEPYAAKGAVVLQAFVEGSLGVGTPMLSDWAGEVPLDQVQEVTTTPELAFISGLPREKQGIARQYAAEHAAMRISGMPLREHVIDSMIFEGHLTEAQFGHMRQGG